LSHEYFYHDWLRVKKRAKAKKTLTRLRTIANKLIRELQRKLPQYLLFEIYQKHFLFYIASVAYRLFDGFVSIAVSMAYGNS
jgi:hypothetical protein